MQLDDSVTQVQKQLLAAAALGDERTREIAAGLAEAAVPAVRMAVLDAVTAAAAEITAALLDSPGAPAVSVQLDGDDVRVLVSSSPDSVAAARPDDGDTSARISFRLSESLKTDIETAAGRAAVSVNSWLIRAAGTALATAHGSTAGSSSWEVRGGSGRRVTGWISG